MVFFPLYLLVMNWVFSFEILLCRIESLRESTWCVSCNGISVVTMMFCWSTWCMFWLSTCGFPWWHWANLCIGVDACFHIPFSGRNPRALFEVLCVGSNIMNLKLFDAYHIIDPRILVVTLEYLGDIRVDWCVSYGVILLRTLGLLVTLIGIAQWIDWKE